MGFLLLLGACRAKAPPLDASIDDAAATLDAGADVAEAASTLPGARPSEGCEGESRAHGFKASASIEVAGKKRTYVSFTPLLRDRRRPLRIVFGFHGDVRTGMDVRDGLDLERHADGEAIFVYPDGLGMTWRTEDGSDKNADYLFFDALLEHFAKTACIDRSRVFLTGFSRGAFFANQLACRREVRAVAPIAGGGPYPLAGDRPAKGPFQCPARSPAAMIFHGEADPNVPYGSGRTSRDFWQNANGCTKTTAAFDPSPCVAFESCVEGRPVFWCSIPKHGHRVWSEAPAAIWRFFESF
jgi:polyhydroxybutyrate depolymerase